MPSASFARRYGPVALVTGASSGIGAEFARRLAARRMHLVLVARRRDRLEALATELSASHGTRVRVVEADLSRPDFLPTLEEATRCEDVGLVVSNAGFGAKGPFLESDLAEMLEMLDVNCRANLLILHRFGGQLRARGRGGIIVTSSTAAFQGLPYSAHYAATKGYGLQLAEGLRHELRGSGVDVLALCPGPTDTEGPKRTGVDPDKVPVKMMDAGLVVEAALAGLGVRAHVVPGWSNRLGEVATRLVPREVASALAGQLLRRAMKVAPG